MRRAASFLLILFACGRCFGGELSPAVVRLLPPDAGLVLGMEWRKALNSKTGEQLQKQLHGPGMVALPGLAAFEKILLEDIDSVVLAAPRVGMAKPGADSPILAVVSGRFDGLPLDQWTQAKRERHRNVELLAPPGVKPPTTRVALLDTQTLLFGDRRELIGAIERWAVPRPRAANRPLLDRAARLAGRYDFWMAMEAPPQGLPSQQQVPAAAMLANLTGVEIGMTFSAGLDAEASLWTKSQQDAALMASALQGMLSMAAMEQGNSPEAPPEAIVLLQKVQIAVAASAVTLRLSLTEEEVESLGRMQAAGGRPAARAAAAPKAPSGPRKIRISGLEGGPVELPVGQPK